MPWVTARFLTFKTWALAATMFQKFMIADPKSFVPALLGGLRNSCLLINMMALDLLQVKQAGFSYSITQQTGYWPGSYIRAKAYQCTVVHCHYILDVH